MYQKRFSLHRKPFQSVLHDGDFFRSQAFEEISPLILHALRSDLGVAVLTGPAGVGKSVSLETVRRVLESDSQVMFLRGGTARTADELLYGLHRRLLKAESAAAKERSAGASVVRRWDVVERLQRVSDFWGPLIVLVDDAHMMQSEVFAELRALLEEENQGHKLLRLLIAGPLVLEEVLAQSDMNDFAQKIRTHVFLQPLRSTESVQYLKHEMSVAGGALADVFDTAAVEKIVAAADGIPRCLNLLADESLMVCEETDQDRVTTDVVNHALSRLQHLPIAWNAAPDSVEDDDEYDSTESVSDQPSTEHSVTSDGSSSVVEFGADSATATSGFVSATPGVIEIGGGAEHGMAQPTPQTPATADESLEVTTPEPESPPPTTPTTPTTKYAVVETSDTVEIIEVAEPTAAKQVPDDTEAVVDYVVGETTSLDLSQPFLSPPDAAADKAPEEVDDEDLTDVVADLDARLQRLCDTQTPAAELDDEPVSCDPECDFPSDELDGEAFEPSNDALDFEHSPSELDASEAEEATSEWPALEPADLGHHLLLASSNDADDANDGTVELGEFSPWEPAGEWPAESVGNPDELEEATSSVEPGLDNEHSTELTDDDEFGPADEFSDEELAPAGTQDFASEATPLFNDAAASVRCANSNPVFDRYTWCELGRSVSSDQVMRHTAVDVLNQPAVWPPEVAGVAPVCSIPVIDLEPQINEQLDELDEMVDAAGPALYDTKVSPELELATPDHADRFASPYDSFPLMPDVDADLTIDQIQEMLHSEMFEESAGAPDEDDNAANLEEPATDTPSDSHTLPDWVEGDVLNALSEVDCETDDVATADDRISESELRSGHVNYYETDEADNEADLDNTPTNRASDDGPGHMQSFIQTRLESYPAPDNTDPNGPSAFAGKTSFEIEEVLDAVLRETIQESEDVNEDAHIYHPQLLQEARSRVISLLSESTELRMAAGAESVAFPVVSADVDDDVDEAAELTNDLALAELESIDDLADFDDESGEPDDNDVLPLTKKKAGRSRFSDLFTRLRRIKND